MKVGICNTKNTVKGTFICKAFTEGVIKSGDEPIQITKYPEDLKLLNDIDVAVQVCFLNEYKGEKKGWSAEQCFRREITAILNKKKKRVITIDTAAILNQHELIDRTLFANKTQADLEKTLESVYYEIGYGGIKNNGIYYNKDSPADRWNQLNIKLKPWRKTGEYILLLGQTHRGLSSQTINIYDWYNIVVTRIRKITNERIVYRMHPRIFKHEGRIKKEIQNVKHLKVHTSLNPNLEDDLLNARCVVAYSTNAATKAILDGIPVFACNEGCITWPVSNHGIKRIKDPEFFPREQWCNDLAYTQWNCAEMKQGLPWQHLRPYVRS